MQQLVNAKTNKLSRSKIELFVDCPRCFYLDRKLGIKRPPSLPFNLNNAVDQLLKNEFDLYRHERTPHPLMVHAKVDAVPYAHPQLDQWRENFKGIEYMHAPTNFLLTGAIDDIWETPEGELIIVDYKATSKMSKVNRLSHVHQAYLRQMDIYRWLFMQCGFKVAGKGYFVYCNGIKNKANFNRHIEFEVHLIAYEGRVDWIEPVLFDIYSCLSQTKIPNPGVNCPYCKYALEAKAYID